MSPATDPDLPDRAEVLPRNRFALEVDEQFEAPALDRDRWVAHYLPQGTPLSLSNQMRASRDAPRRLLLRTIQESTPGGRELPLPLM
jgi:hypothetical protein